MSLSAFLTVFSIGFFSLSSQALLFRDFLNAFEGNELGLGCFFSSWLLWVSIGALAGRNLKEKFRNKININYLPALYVPAFFLQKILLINARVISNVQVFELFPYYKMFITSFFINSPVSVLTGFIFTTACAIMSKEREMPSRIYAIESLGSFIGGVTVTLLLTLHIKALTIALILSLFPLLPYFLEQLKRRKIFHSMMLPCMVVLIFITDIDDKLTFQINQIEWERIFQNNMHEGEFVTAQGKYLYGINKGQFNVVSNGSVIETLPENEKSVEIVISHLAQKSDAKNILIVGESAVQISEQFLKLQQISSVSLYNPDMEYLPELFKNIPEEMIIRDKRLKLIREDIRAHLKDVKNYYDIVIINLGDPVNAALNRYFTKEFYKIVKGSLSSRGIISVGISGGENYFGDVLIQLGSSIYHTLKLEFTKVAIMPGDRSYIFASDHQVLSEDGKKLSKNLTAVKDINRVTDPDLVVSLYNPERSLFQHDKYNNKSKLNVYNEDKNPHAHLFSLLLVGKKSAVYIFKFLKYFSKRGIFLITLTIIIFSFLRILYLKDFSSFGFYFNSFDSQLLVFISGVTSLSLQIFLMFIYQTRYGNLFLYIGLISSLFMLGLYLGSVMARKALSLSRKDYSRPFLISCFFLNLLLLFIVRKLNFEYVTHLNFAGIFLTSGLISGIYFPVSAFRLAILGYDKSHIGGQLETFDHLGGAFGGILAGLLLLPAFGIHSSLGILMFFILMLFVIEIFSTDTRKEPKNINIKLRRAGYIIFGVLLIMLIINSYDIKKERLASRQKIVLKMEEKVKESKESYRFYSKDYVENIRGYGGEISMVLEVDKEGTLMDFSFIAQNETSSYMRALSGWFVSLRGKNILGKDDNSIANVDSVSGATHTTKAVLSILKKAGENFEKLINGKKEELKEHMAKEKTISENIFLNMDFRPHLVFFCFFALAFFLRIFPSKYLRQIFLISNVLLMGFMLNLQYSTHQVIALFSIETNAAFLDWPFLLIFIVPAIVVLFGNMYCGYLCPFGALLEILNFFIPRRFIVKLNKDAWAVGRLLKYGFLGLIIILFLTTKSKSFLKADPLVTIFSRFISRNIFLFSSFMVLISVFFVRFWCRCFCPAGAFLALVQRLNFFKTKLPRVYPENCQLGVKNNKEMDCLCCDRCKF